MTPSWLRRIETGLSACSAPEPCFPGTNPIPVAVGVTLQDADRSSVEPLNPLAERNPGSSYPGLHSRRALGSRQFMSHMPPMQAGAPHRPSAGVGQVSGMSFADWAAKVE